MFETYDHNTRTALIHTSNPEILPKALHHGLHFPTKTQVVEGDHCQRVGMIIIPFHHCLIMWGNLRSFQTKNGMKYFAVLVNLGPFGTKFPNVAHMYRSRGTETLASGTTVARTQ